jgi:excisionase family DNA binding protein
MMTQKEVAQLFKVDPKTVARWSDKGYLSFTRTLGGHRRYYAEEVHRLLASQGQTKTKSSPSER